MINRVISKHINKRSYQFSTGVLCVPMRLYFPEGYAKVFKVNHSQTVKDVAEMIMKEESKNSVQLMIGKKDYMNNEIPFLDFVLHNPVQLVLDGQGYTFDIDSFGAANYIFGQSELETEYDQFEVPYQDSFVISKFHQLLNENIEKLYQNQNVFTKLQLQQAIQATLERFADKNHSNSEFWKTYDKILEQLQQDYNDKQQKVETISVEAKYQGYKLLKKWIIIALIQYGILFYLTYGAYSWNVSEPISYLWQVGLETIGIFYLIRSGYIFRQQRLFRNKFRQVFESSINQKNNSTNFLMDVRFAREKIIMISNKITYGTTSY